MYLDYSATSPLLPEVKTRLHELIDLELGNASALHSSGQLAHHFIEDARVQVACLINADPDEIIFTSGGSESNNTVINTFAGKNIAVSAIEHASILESARAKAKKLIEIPVDEQGKLKLADLPNDVALVSVMFANNELGTIQPLTDLVQHYQTSSTFIHTDATQALGKIPIDVKKLKIDYLTMSAHKIGGPLGVGALYVRHGAPLTPLIYGGHQEHKKRAGTSNTLGIAGFGVAAQWAYQHDSCAQYRQIATLRNYLCERILKEIPHSSVNGYRVCLLDPTCNLAKNAPDQKCCKNYNTLPNILNMSFRAAEGESIQLYLDAAGFNVSTGSACAAGDIQPSHVLMATVHDAEIAHSSIRFSLGLDTTAQDIDKLMQVLPAIIRRLQDMSTIIIGE